MEYRRLGRTGLDVSVVSLGTVSLGLDYGIKAPGQFGKPADEQARSVLRRAAEQGITLFDTAPGYGAAEELLGETLGAMRGCLFATKIPVPPAWHAGELQGFELEKFGRQSLEQSLRALRRDVIDVLQIHNATQALIEQGALTALVAKARADGLVRYVGASVYGERAALAAIQAGSYDVLQVAYNVLDQRMAARVFPAARAAGVGLIVRSALLKGALTSKAQWLPTPLDALREAASRVRHDMATTWEQLPAIAFRFCLSAPAVATTLTGARTVEELDAALGATAEGPLSADVLEHAEALAVDDERLIDPRFWPTT